MNKVSFEHDILLVGAKKTFGLVSVKLVLAKLFNQNDLKFGKSNFGEEHRLFS